MTREQIKANRAKWAEALRSGEYQQCRRRIADMVDALQDPEEVPA